MPGRLPNNDVLDLRDTERTMSRRKQSNPKPIKRPEDEDEADVKTDQSAKDKTMEMDQSNPASDDEQEKEPIEMQDTNSPVSGEEGSPPEEIDKEPLDDNDIKEDNIKTECDSDTPVMAEMSPQRQQVMQKLNFPSDLLTLKKVKEEEFLQTGIPWSISTCIGLSKGTSIGPYQGEMVALSSIKPGQLVLQFQTNDGDLTFIKVTEETGAWLSLLKPAELSASHNTKVYFEGTRIWCEIERDLDENAELVASFTTNVPTDTNIQTPSMAEPNDKNGSHKKLETKSQLSPQHVLRYGCPFCGVRFSSPRTLEGHLQYYCSKKPDDFVSLQDLHERLQKQAQHSLSVLDSQSTLQQGSISPSSGARQSPKGQKRSVEEAQIESPDNTSDGEMPRSKVMKHTELTCSVCDHTAENSIDLHTHMKTHRNNVPKVPDADRLSVSPQCQEEMFCKECNIQFSSLKTYYGHKEFYCRFNKTKKSGEEEVGEASMVPMRNVTPDDLSPKSRHKIAGGMDGSVLLASSKAVIPTGLMVPSLLQSPFLLQAMAKDMPLLLMSSPSGEVKMSPPSDTVTTDKQQADKCSDDQPLDLSKNTASRKTERMDSESGQDSPKGKDSLTNVKSELESLSHSAEETMKLRTVPQKLAATIGQSPIKTPLNIPTILPTFITNAKTQFVNKKPIPPLQFVSRCVECNIVFYKHENYLIHKEHYCSGRRVKDSVSGESSNSDTDMKSPDLQKKSPDASELDRTNGKQSNTTHKVENGDDANRVKATEVCYKYFCIPCKIKFSSAGTLKAHKEFYCPHGKENDGNALIKDKMDKSGEQSHSDYRCDLCKSEFMSARLLKLHICMGEVATAPLSRCLYCDYVTQTENRLAEHIKVHIPTKAFKCNICGYRGNTARGMRMHGKMHVEEGEEFTDDNMIEFEEPPLVPIQRNGSCDKGPIDVETELIRMKNEPYKRRRSRKSFEKSENMVPFLSQNLLTQICAACGQTFSNVSDFVIHLRMHEIAALEAMKNLKTLRCEHCTDYLADSLTSLLVHMQSKHPEQLPGTSKAETEPASGSECERSQSRDSDLSNERSRSNSVESSRTSKSNSSQNTPKMSGSHSPYIKTEKIGNDQSTACDSENNIDVCNIKQELSADPQSDTNGYDMEGNRSNVGNDLDHTNKSPQSVIQDSVPDGRSHTLHSQPAGSPPSQSPSPISHRHGTTGLKTQLSHSPTVARQHSSTSPKQESLVSPKINTIKQEKMSPKQMSPDPKTRYLMSQNIVKQERTSPPIKSPPLKTPPPSSPKPLSASPKLSTIPLAAFSPTLQNLPFVYNPQSLLSLYQLQGAIPAAFNPPTASQASSTNGADKNGRKYCKHCDINFTYLSSFLTHKKYYCSARNSTEESASPTATA